MSECGNCGSTEGLHIHHIVPKAVGGTERETNKVVLCCECHAKVHNFGADYAQAWKRGVERARGVPRKRLKTRLRAAEELLRSGGWVA